jgi:hypothetical protein
LSGIQITFSNFWQILYPWKEAIFECWLSRLLQLYWIRKFLTVFSRIPQSPLL